MELNGRFRSCDFIALDCALKFMPSYGNIELSYLKNILNEIEVEVDINIMERILISYGFCEKNIRNNPVNQALIVNEFDLMFTEKGRELKNLNSLHAFIESEKAKAKERLAIENDRKRETRRNELQFQLNQRQYFVNACIAIATGIAAAYYLIEIVKHHASNLDLNVLTSFVIFLFG